MPRAVFTGSIRKLSVGDPAAHLRAAHIRWPGGRERRDIRCSQRCTVRAPSPLYETLYVPMEDKLMGWNVHPRWSSEYRFFRLTSQFSPAYRRRSKREIGSRSQYPPFPPFPRLLYHRRVIFLQSTANSCEKENTKKSISDAWITIQIARFERRCDRPAAERSPWMKHLGCRWSTIFLEFERFRPATNLCYQIQLRLRSGKNNTTWWHVCFWAFFAHLK